MVYKNAKFTRRFIAFLLDGFFIGSLTRFTVAIHPLLPIIISAVYFALMESSKSQATLGKQIMGIKVQDLNDQRISIPRAFIRHFIKCIGILFFGVGYLSLIIGKNDNEKIAFVDMICSTKVVLTR